MSDTSLNHENDPDENSFREFLSQWQSHVSCTDQDTKRMWSAVLAKWEQCTENQLAVATPSKMERSRSFSLGWTWIAPLAAMVIFAMGVGVGMLLRQEAELARPQIAFADLLDSIAFTSKELVADQVFACEVSRLCQRPVLVRKRASSCDIDGDPYLADAEAQFSFGQRLLVRCVLLERSPFQKRNQSRWQEILREEVIGGREQMFELTMDGGMALHCWSHLLPDTSLWIEVEMNGSLTLEVANDQQKLLEPNIPKVVWESDHGPIFRKLVVVYELLGACDAENVL